MTKKVVIKKEVKLNTEDQVEHQIKNLGARIKQLREFFIEGFDILSSIYFTKKLYLSFKINAMFNKFSTDYGLLIIRLGIGILFMLHGYPKIMGGPEMWVKIGESMGNIGIHFAPTFWGFMAAFAEFVGGACLVLGFLFRPALAMLIFTMFIAGLMHYKSGDGFGGYNHALESGLVFLGLFVAGPGKYALKIVRR